MKRSVHFFNESDTEFPLDDKQAQTLLLGVMDALGKRDVDINVIAVGDEDLREMKNRWFGQDVYTDVISFTLEEEPVLVGELYCSLERIIRNAEAFSETPAREFARILIHGACHLCGFDDGTEEERQAMTEKENTFLTQFYDV